MPEIILKGNWLKEWGFNTGNELLILKTKFGIKIINKNEVAVIVL